MICPFSRQQGSPAGASCKETCAWWDKDAEQCIEVTKVNHVSGICGLLEDVVRFMGELSRKG